MAVVGLGSREEDNSGNQVEMEDIDVLAQNVRCASAVGTKLLQKAKVRNIYMDDFNNAEGMLSLF